MAPPPQNTGGKFNLPNIHDWIFVAIIVHYFIHPGKIHVFDGDPERLLTSLTSLKQENILWHLENQSTLQWYIWSKGAIYIDGQVQVNGVSNRYHTAGNY